MMLNSTNDKRFSTEPLDEAMKELIDVCQQYNDKFAHKQQDNMVPTPSNEPLTTGNTKHQQTLSSMRNSHHNEINQNVSTVTNCDNRRDDDDASSTSPVQQGQVDRAKSSSIEKLQQRQGELQSQLDQVLEVAKNLEAKQKRKLSSILIDQTKSRQDNRFELDEEEDSELIEFQQIENELRVSELNRQLGNIQEELRLRLYNRLLSKTSNGTKSTRERQNQRSTMISSNQSSSTANRRDSVQTDESTPPSSSCSDDQTVSSTISNSDTINSRLNADSEPAEFGRCGSSNKKGENQSILSNTESSDCTDAKLTTASVQWEQVKLDDDGFKTASKTAHAPCHNNDSYPNDLPASALQPNHSYEVPIRASTSKGSAPSSRVFNSSNVQQTQAALDPADEEGQQQICLPSGCYMPNGLRNCPAVGTTNDLERIEEGEEEENEYYSNSSMFRKIYEEKLSPLLQASGSNNRSHSSDGHDKTITDATYPTDHTSETEKRQDQTPDSKIQNDYRFNVSNVNSARRTNRPLTMYMPKPDEAIDLVEMVQAMGHDLAIVSDDLRIGPSSAHGSLSKLCSNNKKWLKRFFAFDRNLKTLSYYENEEQLVRKSGGAPKCVIPFEEICDVYVDHRLSELSEKQRGPKRKSYVFILATIKRKYVLASPRAETMRAWIDILFTAAKANDYFQQEFVANDAVDGYPPDCPDF